MSDIGDWLRGVRIESNLLRDRIAVEVLVRLRQTSLDEANIF